MEEDIFPLKFHLSRDVFPPNQKPNPVLCSFFKTASEKTLSGKIATLQDGEEQQTSRHFFGISPRNHKYLVLVPPSHVSFTYHSHTSRNSGIGILMGAKKMAGYRGPWIFAWFKSEFRPNLKSLTFPVSNVACSKASLLWWKLFWWTRKWQK